MRYDDICKRLRSTRDGASRRISDLSRGSGLYISLVAWADDPYTKPWVHVR